MPLRVTSVASILYGNASQNSCLDKVMLGMVVSLATISIAITSTAVLQSAFQRPCDNICIQEHIDNCDNFQFRRQSEFGGSTVSMTGIQSDGNCSIEIHASAEISQWKCSCSVPMDKLREWRNWDVEGGLDSSQIASYCTEI